MAVSKAQDFVAEGSISDLVAMEQFFGRIPPSILLGGVRIFSEWNERQITIAKCSVLCKPDQLSMELNHIGMCAPYFLGIGSTGQIDEADLTFGFVARAALERRSEKPLKVDVTLITGGVRRTTRWSLGWMSIVALAGLAFAWINRSRVRGVFGV
ncbi:hypothetical protein ZHAS_00014366 [Anopheles sinensis]|uniref:Uncharacterized protein n=1 Tax=Anopheles sinensis TaxID=74873 RepID=A0A084W830_ANOSI|nr:hypothetical protein ZHAS_00014366 [Anopheles sinensis]